MRAVNEIGVRPGSCSFEKRIYIPLPEPHARESMFRIHLGETKNCLTGEDFRVLADRSEGCVLTCGMRISACGRCGVSACVCAPSPPRICLRYRIPL